MRVRYRQPEPQLLAAAARRVDTRHGSSADGHLVAAVSCIIIHQVECGKVGTSVREAKAAANGSTLGALRGLVPVQSKT